MRFGTTLVVFLGGCNLVFGTDAEPADPPLDVPPPSCAPVRMNYDDFETPTLTPCGWGYLTQESCVATVENGALAMSPQVGVVNTICVCGSTTPFPFTSAFGTMAEVDQLGGMEVGEYTRLTASDEAKTMLWDLGYEATTDSFSFNRDRIAVGSLRWDPALRWWRIRPDDNGTGVLGEVSADGRLWMLVGRDPSPPPATIQTSFQEGTFVGLSAPSTVRLASINVCP